MYENGSRSAVQPLGLPKTARRCGRCSFTSIRDSCSPTSTAAPTFILVYSFQLPLNPRAFGWMLRTNLTTRLRRHASALDLRLRRGHSVLVHQDLRAAGWRSRTPASRTSSLRYRIKRKPSAVTTARCKTASTIARGRRPAWIGSTRRCQPPDGHRDLPSWASTP